MADQLPLNFNIPPEPILVSYDYTDFASGLGYVEYYLSAAKDSSGTDYLAITNDLASAVQCMETNEAQTPKTFIFYTSEFNSLRRLNGKAYFSCCIGHLAHGGLTISSSFQVKFYKYDGVNSTQIGSTWQSTNYVAAVAAKDWMVLGKVSLPETKIKKGEQIKIEIIVSTSESGGGDSQTCTIGIDPSNSISEKPASDYGLRTTIFKLLLPYKIEV